MLGIDYIDSNSKPLMLVGNVNILRVDNDVTDDIIKDNSSIKTGVSKNLISNLNKKNFF